MIIRPAHPHEVEAIRALFASEVAAGRMLPRAAHGHPRAPGRLARRRGAWCDRRMCLAGCSSTRRCCEVRSLAVDPACPGRGIASALVREALAMAERRGMERVLVLTRAASLFEKLGFRRDFVANFPEKVWRDCAPCPFRHACDEIALIYPIREPARTPYLEKEPTVARRS